MKKPTIVIAMPAYKAAETLEKTYREIPEKINAKVIVVDDASPDETVNVAKSLGIKVIRHRVNKGYGRNQKTCYDKALAMNADIVVLLHPDYQYDPKTITDLIEPLINGSADLTFGSRFANDGNPVAGGMPFYRYIGNRLTTVVENLVLGTDFSELHSGLKAYTRKFLKECPYHQYSDKFVFDSQLLIDAVLRGARIREIPIPTRYTEESSSVDILSSVRYIIETFLYLIKRKMDVNIRQVSRNIWKCIVCEGKSRKVFYSEKGEKGKISSRETLCTGEENQRNAYATIWQCRKCRIIFQEPSFSQKELDQAYRESKDELYLKQKKERGKVFQKSLESIEKYKSPPGRLLDVGCGVGLFISTACTKGWNVEGMEPSIWASKIARKTFRMKVHADQFESMRNKPNSFDVLTMWDVLEHFMNPVEALCRANTLLKNDGILALTTIDMNSWFSRLLGPRWPWLIRIHLWYFTPETLKRILEKTGFEIQSMSKQIRWFSLPYIVERLTGKKMPYLPNLTLPTPTGDILFVIAKKKTNSV